MEQNSYPGLVHRLFLRLVKKAFFAMQPYDLKFLGKNAQIVGNPLDLMTYSKEEALQQLGLPSSFKEEKIVVVMGGSLGAQTINKWIVGQDWGEGIIYLVSGAKQYEAFKSFANERRIVVPFINNMAAVYSMATICIARAGASSISELLFFNRPTVFIPYPYASNHHQHYNASFAKQYIRSILVEERDLFDYSLPALMQALQNTRIPGNSFINNAKDVIYENIMKEYSDGIRIKE